MIDFVNWNKELPASNWIHKIKDNKNVIQEKIKAYNRHKFISLNINKNKIPIKGNMEIVIKSIIYSFNYVINIAKQKKHKINKKRLIDKSSNGKHVNHPAIHPKTIPKI